MTFPEFDKICNSLISEVLHMRDTKGKEYAGTKDRFDNFNRLASRLKIDRKKVWQVYFTKHLDAIESYIDNGQTYSAEGIRGRIIDAITYFMLLEGMIEEDLQKSSANTYDKMGNAELQTLPYEMLHRPSTELETMQSEAEVKLERCPVAKPRVGQCILPLDHTGDHDVRKVWITSHVGTPSTAAGLERFCGHCMNLIQDHEEYLDGEILKLNNALQNR